MDDKFKITALFIFILITLTVSYWQDWSPGDDTRLWDSLIEGRDEEFLFPMLYYVGRPAYEVIGEAARYILPLIFLIGGFFVLTKIFREFKLPQEAILLSFATTLFSINFLGYFMKDSLMFFLACLFAYFFFRIRYKNIFCWWKLLAILPIMVMTREMGIAFVAFAGFLVLTKMPKKYFLATAVFPNSPRWTINLINLVKEGWDNLLNFDIHTFQLPNPIYWVSTIAIIFTRDLFHIVLMAITVIMAASMTSWSWECCVFRYTFSFMPLHLFYVGKALQSYKWLYVPLIFGASAGILKLGLTVVNAI